VKARSAGVSAQSVQADSASRTTTGRSTAYN
jgi:hypothetical protein